MASIEIALGQQSSKTNLSHLGIIFCGNTKFLNFQIYENETYFVIASRTKSASVSPMDSNIFSSILRDAVNKAKEILFPSKDLNSIRFA